MNPLKTNRVFIFVPVTFFLYAVGNLGGCTSVQRSASSGYAPGEHADKGKRPAYPVRKTDNQKLYLAQLENSIPTKEELRQYSKLLPLFRGDAEKIEYLTLPSFEDRQLWVRDRHLAERANSDREDYKDVVDAQDIALGMPLELVQQSWGKPDSVDTSGHPEFKNQRWYYHKMISTPSGYKSESRVVDFSGGRVAGWEVR